jgi:ribonuclease P protein component
MGQAPQRLKRRREFLHVARAGRKWAVPGLVLQVLDRHAATQTTGDRSENRSNNRVGVCAGGPAGERGIRVGFTVTRKVGGAVIRNRTRRRLRAAVERVMPTHAAPGRDYVVIGRAGTDARPFSDLVGDLETALRKLNAWHDAETAAIDPEYDEEKSDR